MKRFFLVALSTLVSFALWADSFSAATTEGQVVYYSTISSTEVEVTGMANLSTYTGTLTIPETVYNGDTPYTVTKLGYNDASTQTGCFEQSTFSAINLPATITYIEEWTFYKNTNLTSLVFPSKVTVINDGVCSGCSALSSVSIPEGVTYIGRNAFASTSIIYLTIPNTVTTFGEQPFTGCKYLLHVDLSTSLTAISHSAFSSCVMLQDLEIPGSVKTVEHHAFNTCTALSEVIINEGVEAIDYDAFANCDSLKEIVLPSTLTTLEYSVFSGCAALESVTLSEALTKIDRETFSGCAALKEISLPEGITEIGYCAFKDCTSLSAVYSLNTTPPTCNLSDSNETPFDGVDLTTCVLYVPCDGVEAYTAASVWKDFVNIVGIDCQEELGTFACTVAPEDKSVLDEALSQITFYNDNGIYYNEEEEYGYDGEPIVVYDSADNAVAYITNVSDIEDANGKVIGQMVAFDPEVSAAGDYTVVVPACFFYSLDDEDLRGFNDQFSLSYTIAEIASSDPSYEIVVTPESGATIESLSAISLTCEDVIMWNTLGWGDIVIYDEEDNALNLAIDYEEVPNDTGIITEVILTIAPAITDEGTYRVEIPADYFFVAETIKSQALTLYYTIENSTGTGISGAHGNEVYGEDIYSPAGQKINATVKGVNIIRYNDGTTKKVLRK